MDKDTQRIRAERWREIILAAANSGLTKKEWCRQNGVSLDSLYYWQHKLREQDAETLKDQSGQDVPQVPVVSSHTAVSANPAFVDVTQQAAGQLNSFEGSPQPAQRAFIPELVLQDGKFQLLIGSTTTKRTLSMVLKAIADA